MGTQIAEAAFANDLVLHAYNDNLVQLTHISSEYIPSRNEYEVLWSKFTQFLMDFEKTSDYMVFKPENIYKLEAYRKDKDARALVEINAAFNELHTSYMSLVS